MAHRPTSNTRQQHRHSKGADSLHVVHEMLQGGLPAERIVQNFLEYTQSVDVVQHSLEA